MNGKLTFFLFATVLTLSASADVCGQLAAVKGKGVEVLRLQGGRDGEKVRHGMRVEENKVLVLECDDVVLAGRDSSAKIILANGKLSLGPESRFELAAHEKANASRGPAKVNLVHLTYGKMRALIQQTYGTPAKSKKTKDSEDRSGEKKSKESSQSTFRVRTFSAVAGVRGTDFFTSYEPNTGVTEQATIEGSVEVQQTGTAQTVLVGAGKQVSVDTTPAAVAAAQEQLKSGTVDMETPKVLPDASTQVKPLEVTPIRESLRNEIRVASAIVKDDREFAHAKAVETLGKPETWTMEREKVPDKLNRFKNEF